MSQIFSPRLSTPSATDLNWIHYTKGGTNYCIIIKSPSVLPNCVGYAWGRWSELLHVFHNLSRANAEDWFGKADGYARGQIPKLGAIACWRKGRVGTGNDGAGHVSVVEQINDDGSIITSNSNYGGTLFFLRTIKAPYNIGSDFTFQGFIYPPVDFIVPIPVPVKSNTEVAKEVINGNWGNGADRKARLTASGYNYSEIQKEVDKLLSPAPQPAVKSIDDIAREVIRGDWGNGVLRRANLIKAGYNYQSVQARVDQILSPTPAKKTTDQIAKEVINGVWGNGADRKARLTAAGYDYNEIQKKVNKLI